MISFATNLAFTPDLPAHSFQAPTLIGCQIFKEQGTAYSVLRYFYFRAFRTFRFRVLFQKQRNEIMKDIFDTVKLTPGFNYNLMTVRQRRERKVQVL